MPQYSRNYPKRTRKLWQEDRPKWVDATKVGPSLLAVRQWQSTQTIQSALCVCFVLSFYSRTNAWSRILIHHPVVHKWLCRMFIGDHYVGICALDPSERIELTRDMSARTECRLWGVARRRSLVGRLGLFRLDEFPPHWAEIRGDLGLWQQYRRNVPRTGFSHKVDTSVRHRTSMSRETVEVGNQIPTLEKVHLEMYPNCNWVQKSMFMGLETKASWLTFKCKLHLDAGKYAADNSICRSNDTKYPHIATSTHKYHVLTKKPKVPLVNLWEDCSRPKCLTQSRGSKSIKTTTCGWHMDDVRKTPWANVTCDIEMSTCKCEKMWRVRVVCSQNLRFAVGCSSSSRWSTSRRRWSDRILGDWKIIFGTNLSTLNIGLMMYGRAQWQKAEETRKDFNIVPIHQDKKFFFTSELFKVVQDDEFRIDTGRPKFEQQTDSILYACESYR